MTATDLTCQVKAVLGREWNLDPALIPDDAALNAFPRWDSLGHVTILLALEAAFGLRLSADTVQALTSVPKIVAHLESSAIREAA